MQGAPVTGRRYPVQVVGAAIVDSLDAPTRLLVARRSAPPALAGMWEFPGGKVEPGESACDGLLRELVEELGVRARLGRELVGAHQQGWILNEKAAMRVFLAEITAGNPRPLEDHNELRWVPLGQDSAAELLGLEWIPANYPIVAALLSAVQRGL